MAAVRNNETSTTTVFTHQRPEPAVHQSHVRTNGSYNEQQPLLTEYREDEERLQWEPLFNNESQTNKRNTPKFEAFMMTGEHILNISRKPQTNIVPKQQKKVIYFYLYCVRSLS